MENSIGEDIKIINNFITYFNKNIQNGNKADLTVLGEEINAIEHILSDYKRVLKEKERISSENGIGKRQYEELVDDYEKLNLENIKLQKENEKLKKNNKELLRKLRNRVKEVKKLQKYSLYKKEFSRLNKQLQNKDKIINLMSEQFAGLTIFDIDKDGPLILSDKEEVKQYFENKAKEK